MNATIRTALENALTKRIRRPLFGTMDFQPIGNLALLCLTAKMGERLTAQGVAFLANGEIFTSIQGDR